MTYLRIKLSNGEVVDAEFIEFVGLNVAQVEGCYGALIGDGEDEVPATVPDEEEE